MSGKDFLVFAVGVGLGYYVVKHYRVTGKAA